MRRKLLGSISVGTAISVGFSLIAGVATGIVWIENTVNTSIAPVEAQTNQNTANIAAMQSDIEWIKAALDQNGFRPRSPVATSTN